MTTKKSNLSVYTPALNGAHLRGWEKNDKTFNNKSVSLIEDDSAYKYDHFLISAGHNYKKDSANLLRYKDLLDNDKNIIIGDSGGFQIAKGVIEYSDKMSNVLFDWLDKNCNYAMSLDIPPYFNPTEDHFQYALKTSSESFKKWEQKQNKSKLINILHGRNERHLNQWFDAVKDRELTGGWAIGSSTLGVSIFYLLQSFFYLYDNKVFDKMNSKQILHLLGFSRNADLHFVLYLQNKLNFHDYNFKITFDSSSYSMTAAHGNWFVFPSKRGMGTLTISNRNLEDFKEMNEEFFCNCAACENLNYSDIYDLSFNTRYYSLSTLHNLIMFLEYKKKLELIVNVSDKVSSVNDSYFTEYDKRVFKIIDECFNNKGKAFNIILKNKETISKGNRAEGDCNQNINKSFTDLF